MKKYIIILLAFVILYGCKHELEKPSWDINLVLPLINSELTVYDLINDSNISIEENNGFISIIYEDELINTSLDTLVNIDAIADEQTHTLDSVSFADVIIKDTATIGAAINEIPFGSILLPDGSTNNIPAFPGIANQDTINIDASEYFETMTLYKGTLIVEITNNYPTDISNINLSLINSVNQSIIATFSFPIINSGTSIIDSVSIGGQTLDENILAILHNMDINASSGPVLIDYNDAIITQITLANIGVTEATAIFPEQQLTETLKEHSFNFSGAEIEEIGIKSGTVTIYVLSTLPNGKMIYNIPSLTKNGIPFTSGDIIIPEATNTNLTSFEFNFEGYKLNLKGKENRIGGDTINTIYTEAYTYIDSTGILETINYTDSFYSYIQFEITPEYAIGYLGQDTIEIGPEQKETNIFNNFNAELLDIENANITLYCENYIGADIGLQIHDLSVVNQNLTVSSNIDPTNLFYITSPTLDDNLNITPTTLEIKFDADEMIEILPQQINTHASIYINPNENNSGFLFPEYPIKTKLNIEIPLSIIANEFILTDTTEININEDINIKKIYLNIENGFPLSANIDLILLDQNSNTIDTMLSNAHIEEGKINSENIVITPGFSTLELETKNLLDAKKILIISKFNTEPVNQFIKIFSDYKLKINMSANLQTEIGK